MDAPTGSAYTLAPRKQYSCTPKGYTQLRKTMTQWTKTSCLNAICHGIPLPLTLHRNDTEIVYHLRLLWKGAVSEAD